MRFFSKETSKSKQLNPEKKVKLSLFSNRLKITQLEAEILLEQIEMKVSKILNVPITELKSKTEFCGRDLDLVLTINKQNTPRD